MKSIMFAVLVLGAVSLAGLDRLVLPAARTIGAACDAPTMGVGVRWESFGDDEGAKAAFMKEGLGFLSGAMSDVCADAALKAEARKQIKFIRLSQAYGAADPIIYLVDGVLHVEYLWAQGEPGPDRAFVRSEIAARLRGEELEAP